MAEEIQPVSIVEETRHRYLHYALSVITSRALPDVRDGLKPVQRRILYAMFHELRLTPEGRPAKCARIVGDVMGKFHPHGDAAIYDSLVRMATNMPPHNLGEVIRACVHLIEDSGASTAELLQKVKGPDFPLGGKIVTDRTTLRHIYEEGQGSIKVQAEWKLEEAGKNKKR